ncbi:hypothetical protein D1Y84_17655 [Acidipila sp. EB88]|nr:hypothetical protein D1Y84_17655 [Acidipila sp. EB88]
MTTHTHRFFIDHTFSGGNGVQELPPPPWTPALKAEFRYPYDVLEQAIPLIKAEGLRFYITKEAYRLPEYGPKVVPLLLQEERCKEPVYGRHVRAVIRNLLSYPYLGYRPHLGFTSLEAILTFEYARDCYTSWKSRRALAQAESHPPADWPAMVRREPVTIRLPLGYHSQQELPQVHMADRQLDTFFVGQVRNAMPRSSYQSWISSSKVEARAQTWKILEELKREGKWRIDLGEVAGDQGKSHAAVFNSYSEKMLNSRICVAPRGTMADTYRTFEGLRAGCLVVANPLPTEEFLYPGAPLVIIDHWRELRGVLERYARNIDALEEYRSKALAWWDNHLRPEVLAVSIARDLNAAGDTLLS